MFTDIYMYFLQTFQKYNLRKYDSKKILISNKQYRGDHNNLS